MPKVRVEELPSPGDRYGIQECLGEGSYGKVYQAVDLQAGDKRVAIKIQKLATPMKKYLQQEYAILRDLQTHPNLVELYRVFRNDHDIWFIMELCEGGSALDLVRGMLTQNRHLAEEHISYILKETTKAAIFLHDNQIIHRDIKARNILLTNSGDVKLGDLGISRHFREVLGKTGTAVGSPYWMAPEAISTGCYDSRVDVWSLGITAIELGKGQPPFDGMHPSRALFQIVTNPPPTLNIATSENYVDFVGECLVKNPEYRPYMVEMMEHPFLSNVPKNSHHLSLELKSLLEDLKKFDLPKPPAEIAVFRKMLKTGVDGDMEEMSVEDLASLDRIEEVAIMKEVETRMNKGEFQTFIGDVLLVLNPNERRDIYGDEYHRRYCFKSRSDNAPHIYSVADSAYQNALHHFIPQKILLTGESGSGKTTNFLHLLDHLLYLGNNPLINLDRLKSSLKLLHALTHATTPTNPHSTRSFLTTELKFSNTGKVTGAIFKVSQLEKWRVSSIDMLQGNYHFLHYIYNILHETKQLQLYKLNENCQEYRYFRTDKTKKTDNEKFLKIFEEFGVEDQLDSIYRVVAAVLTIGQIRFGNDDGATITNLEQIEIVAELLKVEAEKLSWALVNYCQARKGTVVRKRCTVDEAREGRDVFANNLYARLVDYIVATFNQKLASGRIIFGEKYSIKIFDYSGFESFQSNNLETLFINCLNEQLHYHFLQRLITWEATDLRDEGLEYRSFKYYDNRKTLDQLMARSEGILSTIDESSKTSQQGSYISARLQTPHKEFQVCHFLGKVTYDSSEMGDKNRDFLPPEIIETLRHSEDPIVRIFFTSKLDRASNLIVGFDDPKSKFQYSQMKKIRTCINTFKSFSLDLLKELSVGGGSGGTHFVKCIRTSLRKDFDKELVQQQLQAFAVLETVLAKKIGYPHRITFEEFLKRYQYLAFDFDEYVEVNGENCRLLLVRLKMEGWSTGKSKVFLKYHNEEYLARLYETHVKKIVKIQSIMRGFLAKCLVRRIGTDKSPKALLKPKMTPEEAAAVIQKAYRESTVRKSYPEFAKDFKTLDEKTFEFIRKFARKWRKRSIFQVLLQFRAKMINDLFSLSQQVHLYNQAVYFGVQEVNREVDLKLIDGRAQVSQWLGDPKPSVFKIPFDLKEIPFYDTTALLTNVGDLVEKEEEWDSPYRWRKLVNPENMATKDVNVSFTREPKIEIKEEEKKIEEKVNCVAELANKDFDYIKGNVAGKQRSVDPVSELRRISRKVSLGGEEDPPFNFQAMLRKTNFERKEPEVEDKAPVYALKKKKKVEKELEDEKEDFSRERKAVKLEAEKGNFSREGKTVKFELAPGLVVEGIEVKL